MSPKMGHVQHGGRLAAAELDEEPIAPLDEEPIPALAEPLALLPPTSALPVVELLPDALGEEAELDPDSDPEAAVFSRGCPVALSRQCVAGEMLLELELGDELLED